MYRRIKSGHSGGVSSVYFLTPLKQALSPPRSSYPFIYPPPRPLPLLQWRGAPVLKKWGLRVLAPTIVLNFIVVVSFYLSAIK
jgi:hypothetical protein